MRFDLLLFFVLLSILALPPAFAESDEIPGYGSKQKGAYSYCLGDVQTIADMLFRGGLTIKGPLKECDISEIERLKFAGLDLVERADPAILARKELFPDLDSVYLNSEANTAALRILQKHHKQITTLVIQQKKALGEDAVKLLAEFDQLSYLQLSCPLEAPDRLIESLPDSVVFLNLFDTGVGSHAPLHPKRLSKLQRLSLNEPVSSAFMNKLQAPKLEELDLTGRMETGSVKHVFRFHNLQYLTFNRQAPPIEDLRYLAAGTPPGGLNAQYHGENDEVARLVGKISEKASKRFNLLRLTDQVQDRAQEFLLLQLKPRIKCTIQNRSPDGYDITCDQSRGVLITEKTYTPGQSLNAYFITKCRGRYLLIDSLSSFIRD